MTNVAIPSTPQVKWRQGNVYANLTLIVFHDVPLLRKKKNIMTVYWLTPFANSFSNSDWLELEIYFFQTNEQDGEQNVFMVIF